MPPKQRTSGRNATNPSENESDSSESFQFITSAQLEKIILDNRNETEKTIKDTIKQELTAMKQEIIRVQSDLKTVTEVANNAIKVAEQVGEERSHQAPGRKYTPEKPNKKQYK